MTGGKLVTYRLMAEKTVDLVCRKMGVATPCETHLKNLPDLEEESRRSRRSPHGNDRERFAQGAVICDCEAVRRDRIEEQLGDKKVRILTDVLHRTRLAKGTCQGGFCAYRLMAMLDDRQAVEGDSVAMLREFLEERWKGVRPILWGAAVKEAELVETIYKNVFNIRAPGIKTGV